MPRNMSFSLTTQQFRDRKKWVTRRLKWDNLASGDVLMGVEKAMGLKPGEKIVRLGLIQIVSVRREPLQLMIDDPIYGVEEAYKEGFPDLTGAQFVEMFCKHMKCEPSFAPNRIEYDYVDEEPK